MPGRRARIVLLAALLASGCGSQGAGEGDAASGAADPRDPGTDTATSETRFATEDTMTETPDRSIHEVLAEHRDRWMARSEVTGTGVGRCDDRPCIVIYLLRRSAEAEAALPDTVEGYPVKLEVTGRVEPRGG